MRGKRLGDRLLTGLDVGRELRLLDLLCPGLLGLPLLRLLCKAGAVELDRGVAGHLEVLDLVLKLRHGVEDVDPGLAVLADLVRDVLPHLVDHLQGGDLVLAVIGREQAPELKDLVEGLLVVACTLDRREETLRGVDRLTPLVDHLLEPAPRPGVRDGLEELVLALHRLLCLRLGRLLALHGLRLFRADRVADLLHLDVFAAGLERVEGFVERGLVLRRRLLLGVAADSLRLFCRSLFGLGCLGLCGRGLLRLRRRGFCRLGLCRGCGLYSFFFFCHLLFSSCRRCGAGNDLL